MTIKKIITFFFFFILLLQVLPVQQIGYVLFSNQLNEEIPHSLQEGNAPAKKFTELDDHLLWPGNACHLLSELNSSENYIFYACSIPNNPAVEINTPPPNQASNL